MAEVSIDTQTWDAHILVHRGGRKGTKRTLFQMPKSCSLNALWREGMKMKLYRPASSGQAIIIKTTFPTPRSSHLALEIFDETEMWAHYFERRWGMV